jgi:predicted NBD/HSP70 family sugar kinase
MNICVGNLQAEVLDSVNIRINKLTPEQVLESAVKRVKGLIKGLNIKHEQLLGVGVGIIGNVDAKRGVSKHAYGLWDKEVAVEAYLSEALDLPVVVENNVRALALAEMELTQHRNNRNMVFIKLGPGIGSAVILDNDIYKGSFNNSGELGHMIIDLNGKKCRCGQTGCLETVASIATLIEDIRSDFSKSKYPALYKEVAGNIDNLIEENIMKAYVEGDKEIIQKVDDLICFLSIGVINSMKFYDPNKIVIYSKMFHEPLFLDKLIKEIHKHDSIDNLEERIEPSRLESQKSVGGLVLVINELFFKIGAIEPS